MIFKKNSKHPRKKSDKTKHRFYLTGDYMQHPCSKGFFFKSQKNLEKTRHRFPLTGDDTHRPCSNISFSNKQTKNPRKNSKARQHRFPLIDDDMHRPRSKNIIFKKKYPRKKWKIRNIDFL